VGSVRATVIANETMEGGQTTRAGELYWMYDDGIERRDEVMNRGVP